ncbi:MAG: carboxypeptidase-like regulatory domain-containing protein, partial [Prevotella sp.]|nr:carboxypeptidase-like regulatory domain-containing protein [Prevotella sp.]
MKRTVFVLTFAAACLMPMAVHAAGEMSEPVQSVQQTRTIKGHVVDENGEPMIGVTIFAGTNNAAGAISDIDGNFTIAVASGTQLRFSYAGYKALTAQAKDGGTYQMEPDVQGLDDVVVIGFGAVKKRDLTGSVASVKSDAI